MMGGWVGGYVGGWMDVCEGGTLGLGQVANVRQQRRQPGSPGQPPSPTEAPAGRPPYPPAACEHGPRQALRAGGWHQGRPAPPPAAPR